MLLWALGGPDRLKPSARSAIQDPGNAVLVSAASIWEISIKRSRGRLDAPEDMVDDVRRTGFEPLPILLQHAAAAGSLPRRHDDPFDRMLVAQAQLEDLTLVTRDPVMAEYEVTVMAG